MANIIKKKVWVVFPATEKSELGDVLYETTIYELALVTAGMFSRGAHKDWDDAAVYTSKREAEADAKRRMEKAGASMGPYRSAYDRS